ncbi:MAG: hypothetical protein QW165_04550 [Candidatus Woesearchaeota archaeon]
MTRHQSLAMTEAVKCLRAWFSQNPQGVTMQEIKEYERVNGARIGLFASALSHLEITGQVEILKTENGLKYRLCINRRADGAWSESPPATPSFHSHPKKVRDV